MGGKERANGDPQDRARQAAQEPCRHRSRARTFPFPPKHATHGLTGPVEHFQFETLRVPNPAGWRFAEKTRSSRLAWAGRRCAATSRFPLFKGKTLSPCTDKTKRALPWERPFVI